MIQGSIIASGDRLCRYPVRGLMPQSPSFSEAIGSTAPPPHPWLHGCLNTRHLWPLSRTLPVHVWKCADSWTRWPLWYQALGWGTCTTDHLKPTSLKPNIIDYNRWSLVFSSFFFQSKTFEHENSLEFKAKLRKSSDSNKCMHSFIQLFCLHFGSWVP